MAYAPSTPYEGMTSTRIDDVNVARVGKPSIHQTNRKNIYRGFTTVGRFGRDFGLNDKELVMQDLWNHIYTIPGERRGRAKWGTIIPMLAFEGATPETIAQIETELTRVVNSDPRVQLMAMSVTALPDNNAIMALLDLKFIELDNVVDTMRLTFGQG